MKKSFKIQKFIVAVLVIAAMIATTGAITLLADPGDKGDPLITLSYIEDVLKGEMSFKAVDMTKGQTLTCEAGTELILRMGKATIISTEKGGLADTTTGEDLKNGMQMPGNHHLVVPVGDGRGIVAENNVIVLVKGDYILE